MFIFCEETFHASFIDCIDHFNVVGNSHYKFSLLSEIGRLGVGLHAAAD